MPPWNDWYHVIGTTYGAWLPGDPRGFRSKHHREHCEGDYKSPPAPGKWERRHAYAKTLLKRPSVKLNPGQQIRAADELWRSLDTRSINVIVVAVDATHFHLLARFPDRNPRRWAGRAKQECSHYMKVDGLAPVGGMWAALGLCKPIADRAHQVRVVRYIVNHARRGAAVRHSIKPRNGAIDPNSDPSNARKILNSPKAPAASGRGLCS